MPTLSRENRKLLENTVASARQSAVAGARKALTALRVCDKESPTDPDQKTLRNRLRAHGRQLGDVRQPDGTQETRRLEQACAYEHWHRLLFARFLAENGLLVNPDYGVAMSLAEIQETAREKNQDWLSLASDYAQRMLLEVFRPDDPVLHLTIPPETRQELEESLAQLPAVIFTADDSLGWVYQFWQRDEKERVNKSEVKIGADELSPVTQLFTEDYMVLFLLHNTLGAWWSAKRGAEGKSYQLPDYEWTYLRLNDDGSPAAGRFDGWPRTARDLRVLDPCMGSGHFLVFALPILVRMRQEEEGLSLQDAVGSVLRDNLFGLELDARCSQIAAFNLALAAWRLAGMQFTLPVLNLACSGLGIHASEGDWVKLAGEDGPAREEMRRLYSLFKDAPTLGSLIDPLRLQANVYAAGAEQVLPLLEDALKKEQSTDEAHELVIAAQGVLAAFRILASRFTLVVTNVPYLGRGKQAPVLAQYCGEFHSDAKADLATCFVERCLTACSTGGTAALVTPQNWWFLGTYRSVRASVLLQRTLKFIVTLGEEAWQSFGDRGPVAALMIVDSAPPQGDHELAGLDALQRRTIAEKITEIRTGELRWIIQGHQYASADHRITVDPPTMGPLLLNYATCNQGIGTADANRYIQKFWEIIPSEAWAFYQMAPVANVLVSGCHSVVRWEGGNGTLARSPQARICGQPAWGKTGIAVAVTRDLYRALYLGGMFDCTLGAMISTDRINNEAVAAFVLSTDFVNSVRRIDKALSVTESSFLKVPFDVIRWRNIAAEEYPHGLPKPESNDPTQWVFNGHPSTADYPLQVALARLVGYLWPRETGSSFPGCPALEPDGLESHGDSDGIVCMSSIGGEASAADRLRAILVDAYGEEWSAAKLTELLNGSESLEAWLRDRFFEEHYQIFHQRPFVWHIWDGRRDGFHALLNYHKLAGPNGEGRKTIEKLIYTSLGDWVSRQQAEVEGGVDGAEGRLAAAKHLKVELTNIMNGEPPYDLFIRWKPLHEQPMGWEPDLNDGIRLNMRPWLHAKPYQEPNQKLKQGACILRVTPIKLPLGKDRGKEPLRDKGDFPWYATSQDRTNDEHFTLEQKRAARERKKKA
jgi:hypothetical protein